MQTCNLSVGRMKRFDNKQTTALYPHSVLADRRINYIYGSLTAALQSLEF